MKKVGLLVAIMIVCVAVTACGCQNNSEDKAASNDANENASQAVDNADAMKNLKMTINGTEVNVAWEDNESVDALKQLAKENPLTINMSMYGGFEQVGSIGQNLPRNDVQTTTSAGDIMLYSGNQLTVFYGSNSWAYTRLGRITDKSESQMKELLGNGDVTITFSILKESTTSNYDPYGTQNRYDVEEKMFERQSGVDYGRVEKDVSYYSTVAGDYKQCNVLLPAGYNENEKYPVMYVFHGFDGSHSDQINDGSFLTLLYGNMLQKGLTVPMIIVNVDMYTDKQSEKSAKSEEQLRYIYDKAIDDVAIDLMPFIEKTYSVKTGRENTAVAGLSEGGAKSLCTGFKWLDKFGYIAGFAPDTGVIPTEFYKGTFWNTPVFDKFPQPTEANTPYYLYMSVGDKDPWNIDCTLYYRDVLGQMGVKNQTDYVKGYGHDEPFWEQCFYNFLNKIFR